jgi:hypothetical protein
VIEIHSSGNFDDLDSTVDDLGEDKPNGMSGEILRFIVWEK